MRKPRSDAVLLNLPEEQQCKLADWLLSGMPYHEAKVLVEKEFGVPVKSLSSFGQFWSEVCQPALLARRAKSAGMAEAVSGESKAAPFGVATLKLLDQKAFEVLQNPSADPNEIKAVLGLFVKAQGELRQREALGLEKNRFQRETCGLFIKWVANEEAKAVALGAGDNSAKIEQLGRMMFGEDWEEPSEKLKS
jgi:hypothetical protein